MENPDSSQSSNPPPIISIWDTIIYHVHHPQKLLITGLVEFISTFIFVFASSSSNMAVNNLTGNKATVDGLISTAIAHAFAFFVAVSISTNYSSGHANPAVCLGAFIAGNITIQHCILYWFAQLLASIVACAVLMLAAGQRVPTFEFSEGGKALNMMVLETVMTFGLAYTVYATDDVTQLQSDNKDTKETTKEDKPNLKIIAPIAMGSIVGANVMAGGVFDGASMNPVLSFGPALVSWRWAGHWVYWVGPLIGGAFAGFSYDMIYITSRIRKKRPKKPAQLSGQTSPAQPTRLTRPTQLSGQTSPA